VDVTVVEAAQRVLPGYDEELTQPVLDALQKSGIVLHLGCSVQGWDAEHGVHVRSDERAEEFALPAERVLVAVGRRPRTAGFGLESLQLTMAGRHVAIDGHCRTSMRNVWAIGDVTGEPMLAHRAMAQGECVAEQIAGKNRSFAPVAIPAVCFTDPEVVVAGKTPGEARAAGIDCIDAAFPFAANGRAMTLEATGGFVRVVARKSDHVILGWQAVGRGVSELAAAFGQSLELGAAWRTWATPSTPTPRWARRCRRRRCVRWGRRCTSDACCASSASAGSRPALAWARRRLRESRISGCGPLVQCSTLSGT